ncbi:MAG: hypothetical protein ACRCT8_12095 [Lacipirellulaceae bacterium]
MASGPSVACLFLQQWRGYDAGDRGELTIERAAELVAAGVVEADFPTATPAPAGAASGVAGGAVSGVGYEAQEMLAAVERALAEARDEKAALEATVEALRAELAALRGRGGDEETAEVSGQQAAPPVTNLPIAEPVVSTPAAPAVQPAVPATDWRTEPVAGLGIPASIKGRLMAAGIRTAGELAEAVDSGAVIAIDGIGEAKAGDLRRVIDAMRA